MVYYQLYMEKWAIYKMENIPGYDSFASRRTIERYDENAYRIKMKYS